MRNFIYLLVTMMCPLSLFGQFENGTYTLGGELRYQRAVTSPDNASSLVTTKLYSIRPEFGIFVVSNMQLGLSLFYSHSDSKPGSSNTFSLKSSNQGYGGALSARYYFHYFFVEGRYEIGKNKFESGGNFSGESKAKNKIVSLGRAFLISKEVSIEPKLSYRIAEFGINGDTKSNALYFSVGINTYINKRRTNEENQ
jgi:Autotransporter beta-domain